jgi:hypothetical protein
VAVSKSLFMLVAAEDSGVFAFGDSRKAKVSAMVRGYRLLGSVDMFPF